MKEQSLTFTFNDYRIKMLAPKVVHSEGLIYNHTFQHSYRYLANNASNVNFQVLNSSCLID